MAEQSGGGRARGARSPFSALAGVIVTFAVLAAGCSGEGDGDSHSPPMADTGAKLPDACRLLDGDMVDRLVGPSTMAREKNDEEHADCRWESKGDPSPDAGTPSGLLQVGAYTQSKQVQGGQKYNDARIAYKAAQLQRPCTPLRMSADEACWQRDDSGVHVAVRKGYTTVTVRYTAAHSPALDESKKEKTAAALATEVLDHLST